MTYAIGAQHFASEAARHARSAEWFRQNRYGERWRLGWQFHASRAAESAREAMHRRNLTDTDQHYA